MESTPSSVPSGFSSLPTLPPPSHQSPTGISNRRPLASPTSSPNFRPARHLVVFPASPERTDQFVIAPAPLSPCPRSPSALDVVWGVRRNSCHSIVECEEEVATESMLGLTTTFSDSSRRRSFSGVITEASKDIPCVTPVAAAERGRSQEVTVDRDGDDAEPEQLRRPKRAWILGERCGSTDSGDTIVRVS